MLCEWDPHSIPILAEVGGKVRFEDIVEGETMRIEKDPSGHIRRIDHGAQGRPAPADRHRRRPRARSSTSTTCPSGPTSKSREGQKVAAGTLLAKTPREVARHAGHHRRSAARHRDLRGPQAEGPGRHRRDRRHGRAARARSAAASGRSSSSSESGIEREHLVPHGKHLRVHAGDYVEAGDAAGRRAARAARHPPHLRRGGGAAVPAPRDPERLPQPARGDRRQAHRDHRRPDAPQGEGRDASATPACCPARSWTSSTSAGQRTSS